MVRWTRRAFFFGSLSLPAVTKRPRNHSEVASEKTSLEDPLTGRKLIRLTDPSILHHLPHYHNRSIAYNNSFLLVASERSGSRQFYRLNLPDGDMKQITDGAGVHPYSATLDRRARRFFYLQKNSLIEGSVTGGRPKVLYRSTANWHPTGHLSLSSNEQFIAIVEMQSGHQVDDYKYQFEKRPRCRIQMIETQKKKARTLTVEDHWLSHPRFRPHSTDLVYAHEGPWNEVDGRLRYISFDGTNKKNLRPRKGNEQIGHAYWSATGQGIYYVFFPDTSGRGAEIRYMNLSTGTEKKVGRCSGFRWLSSNFNNSVIVGASLSLAGPNIYLFFPKLEREITMGEHASSRRLYSVAGSGHHDPFSAHPEPIFSPDSRWIYYVTDREGKPALYAMDVSDFVETT